MSENQKLFMKQIFELRKKGDITYRDITVLNSAMFDLSFDKFNKLVGAKIVRFTGINKSDVSKSVVRMRDLNILIQDSFGLYKLNLNINI